MLWKPQEFLAAFDLSFTQSRKFRERLVVIDAELFHHDLQAQSRRHQLPCLSKIVDGEHVEKARDLCRCLDRIRGQQKRMTLFVELADASIAPLTIQNQI